MRTFTTEKVQAFQGPTGPHIHSVKEPRVNSRGAVAASVLALATTASVFYGLNRISVDNQTLDKKVATFDKYILPDKDGVIITGEGDVAHEFPDENSPVVYSLDEDQALVLVHQQSAKGSQWVAVARPNLTEADTNSRRNRAGNTMYIKLGVLGTEGRVQKLTMNKAFPNGYVQDHYDSQNVGMSFELNANDVDTFKTLLQVK